MRSTVLLIIILLMITFNCEAKVSQLDIIRPTIEQEATSIWRTINDIAFLEKQGYSIRLPKEPLIDSLILKSKNGTFGNDEFQAIYILLENKIYDSNSYDQAIQNVQNQLYLIDKYISTVHAQKNQWDWKFNMFEKYQIIFTLFGTGGSYNPDAGIITLMTDEEGGFKKYDNPAYTIIHEITHMGLEYSIVHKYNLSHGLKERIVDTIVFLLFQEKLPNYQIQQMGDSGLDNYLNKKSDIQSLDAIISKFVNK